MPYERKEVKICFYEDYNLASCGLYQLMEYDQITSYYTHTVWWVNGTGYKEIGTADTDITKPADIEIGIQDVELYDHGYCYKNLSSR